SLLHMSSIFFFSIFFYCSGDHPDLHSFPTRRSSDLSGENFAEIMNQRAKALGMTHSQFYDPHGLPNPKAPQMIDTASAHDLAILDRKSTRLNSSHLGISYAVFCLKKKKKNIHKSTNT